MRLVGSWCSGSVRIAPPGAPLRRAFTLPEALVAITLIAMAGATLLLATETAMDSSAEALETAQAEAYANLLLDEVLGLPYMESGEAAFGVAVGTETGEVTLPLKRANFDDTDDYWLHLSYPPRDPWNNKLGQGDGAGGVRHPNFRFRENYFDEWFALVQVTYADSNSLSASAGTNSTSPYRAVEVTVGKVQPNRSFRQLAKSRRVYGYIPAVN